jgi:hypothetical protein
MQQTLEIVLNVNEYSSSNNYWTPLADLVEVSECIELINPVQDVQNENSEPSRYQLPFGGATTSKERHGERRLLRLKEKKVARVALKERVLNGQEPYAWLDSGATSTFIAPQDKKHLQATGKPSTKKVKMPNGQMEQAGEQMTLKNGLRHPANSADTIPSLKTSLVSNSKLADAGYITVYDENEVNVYDGKNTVIKPTQAAIMTGQDSGDSH